MTKQNSVFDKFQEFWKDLDYNEQKDLWDVMTALRGPDVPHSRKMEQIKLLTTARIRFLLIGAERDGARGYVLRSLAEAKRCIGSPPLSPKKAKEFICQPQHTHFRSHLYIALKALIEQYPVAAKSIYKSIGLVIN